jgi:hypothetical protein
MIATMVLAAALFADPVQLDCPLTGVGAQRGALNDELVSRPTAPGDGMARLRASVDACAALFGWSARTKDLALFYSVAAAMSAESRRLLEAEGIDVGTLERRILADPSLRGLESGSSAQSAAIRDFAMRHVELIVGLGAAGRPNDRVMHWFGLYIGSRASLESARADFAAI